jgi:hypothetical protein
VNEKRDGVEETKGGVKYWKVFRDNLFPCDIILSFEQKAMSLFENACTYNLHHAAIATSINWQEQCRITNLGERKLRRETRRRDFWLHFQRE